MGYWGLWTLYLILSRLCFRLREPTEESVLVDEILPEGEGTRVAPVGEVEIRSPSAQSRAPTVALSHGLPAAVSGAHAYFDELVPDLMAAVPTATGGQTFAAQPVVKRTPVAPPTQGISKVTCSPSFGLSPRLSVRSPRFRTELEDFVHRSWINLRVTLCMWMPLWSLWRTW